MEQLQIQQSNLPQVFENEQFGRVWCIEIESVTGKQNRRMG